MRNWTRTALIALIALVAIGGALSLVNDSKPEPVGKSSTYNEGLCLEAGVAIVIDFGSSAGLDSITRCAKNFEGSGWDLFAATNVEVLGTNQYSVGFVCRIENFPDAAVQDCKDTPTYLEGSWGYYLLDESGSWRVSGRGSSAGEPKCGLAEGWRFIEAGESIGDLVPRVEITPKECS